MKKWHVHLHERICGDVVVEAATKAAAEYKALHSPEIDWQSDSDVDIDSVKEVDEDGTETEVD